MTQFISQPSNWALRPASALQLAPNDGTNATLPLEPDTVRTATLAGTLGAVTLAATGQVAVAAAMSATLGALTGAGTGKVAESAQTGGQLSALTMAGTGLVGVAGATSAVLAGVVAGAAGKVAVDARDAAQLAPLTATATATVADLSATPTPTPTPAPSPSGGGVVYPREFRNPRVNPPRILIREPVEARMSATLDGVSLRAAAEVRLSTRNRHARAAILLLAA